MASPNTLTTDSHFELEDTSKMNQAVTTIEEIQPIKTRSSIDQFLDHLPEIRSSPNQASSPVVDTLRNDVNWSTTGGREKHSPRSYEQVSESRAMAQYYNKAFATREQPDAIKERLVRMSVITAEIKTNVIISDEYTFLTTMSAFLAARYNRPESSILITLNHSVCMLFGGSFDPAYMLTISAVPDQVKPVLNRRNTALISRFLTEEIQVPADRGVIKFQAIAEENLANGGVTLAAEIEKESCVTPPSSEGFSLSRKLQGGKKRIVRPSQTSNMLTPPASPPREIGLGFDLGHQTTHSRTISDATTSSNPEIDMLKGHLSQLNLELEKHRKTPKPISGKKSSFFKRIVA